MKSVTIRIDERTLECAMREARADGISLSALVRRRLQGIDPLNDGEGVKEQLATISAQLSAVQMQLAEFEAA